MGGAIKGLIEHPTIRGAELKGDSLKPMSYLPLSCRRSSTRACCRASGRSLNQPLKPAIQCWTTVPIYPSGEVGNSPRSGEGRALFRSATS